MLIQAYDFLTLSRSHGCPLQIGGSDQWGNITAGIELIRRMRGKEAYGLTLPLVTNVGGEEVRQDREGRGLARPRADVARTSSISSSCAPTIATSAASCAFSRSSTRRRSASWRSSCERRRRSARRSACWRAR